MTRGFYYGVVLLVLFGLGASFLILPANDEIAYLQYRDNKLDSALATYEKTVAMGDLSLSVVIPLSELYLKYGEIDGSVEILERLLKQDPGSVGVRERLGVYYRQAQRHEDYRRNLEIIRSLRPSEQVLRELSEIYHLRGDYQKQLPVLNQLVRDYPPAKGDCVELAHLYASENQFDNAVSVMERLMNSSTLEMDSNTVELAAVLMVEAGQDGKALKLARDFAAPDKVDSALKLAVRFRSLGKKTAALKLLRPFVSLTDGHPALLAEFVSLQMELDHRDEAFSRLSELFARGELPDAVLVPLVVLALEKRNGALLVRIVAEASLDEIPEGLLIELVEVGTGLNGPGMAATMDSRLGRRYLRSHPLLDVKLAAVSGTEKLAERARGIWKYGRLTDRQRTALARIFLKAGLIHDAKRMLMVVASLKDAAYTEFFDIAELYLELGLTRKGFQVFDAQRRGTDRRDSRYRKRLDLAWMLLAAVEGSMVSALEVLRTTGEREVQIVTDLFFISLNHGKSELALEAARRLHKLSPNETSLKYLVEALVLNRRYAEALPHLGRFVENGDSEWDYAYAEALKKLGWMDKWVGIWVRRAEKGDLPLQEKRSAAFTLLEQGYRRQAERIFRKLAWHAEPDSPDVDQLLYLWERYKNPEGLVWVDKRVRRLSGKVRKLWFGKLIRLSAALKNNLYVDALVSIDSDLLFELVSWQIEKGFNREAFDRLKRLFRQGKLTAETLPLLVRLTDMRGDKKLMRRIALRTKWETLPQGGAFEVLATVLKHCSSDTAGKIRNRMKRGFLWDRPALDAILAVAADDPESGGKIRRLESSSTLSPRQRIGLAGIYSKRGRSASAGRILDPILSLNTVNDLDLFEIATLYMDLDRAEEGLKLFQDQRGRLKQEEKLQKERLEHLILLLTLGSGQSDEIIRWLQRRASIDIALLTDLYYTAAKYGSSEVMIEAAQRMVARKTDNETLANLIEALIRGRRYEKALPYLRKFAETKNSKWVVAYSDVLEKLGRKNEWLELWKSQAKRKDSSKEKQREVAFLLLEKGYRKEAETVFLALALKGGADSQDLDQLFYLWGARPRPKALAWLEKRLRAAPEREKIAWLKRLMTVGQEERIVEYLERRDLAENPRLMNIYLEILITKDLDRFKTVVAREIAREQRAKRLKKLAGLSLQADQTSSAELAYRKILKRFPKDLEAINELGKLAYYGGDIDTAESLFSTFLKTGRPDYLTAFLYAELLWQKKQYGESKRFYKRSRELTSLLVTRTAGVGRMESKILFRLDRKKKALSHYRALLARNPDDSSLRAEFATLLMEMGRDAEASRVLE
ncbi:MAG: tetratricopeptide repeat protein [Proteobacteria bacterium]|nr:tetratricopeptide repeat protein [Pseudomonadota bacterium]